MLVGVKYNINSGWEVFIVAINGHAFEIMGTIDHDTNL